MRALHLAVALAAARAALQRAPCEHFIILKYAHTGSTWFVDELIVKRSNAQVKKMVTNAAEVEAWFSEWGGPAPLWRMFHDDGTTSFPPVDGTGQAACDHFLDICERKMGLSTCLKLEKFTMGASN